MIQKNRERLLAFPVFFVILHPVKGYTLNYLR